MNYVTADLKALASNDPAGEFEAILSAPTLDRDGEILDARCFDPLPDHLSIDVDHGLSTASTVGSGVPRYQGDLLKFTGTFSSLPRAQEVRTLVREGHVRTMSVAFSHATRRTDDRGQVHVVRAELLNAAIVPVPSNREALILSSRSWRDRTGGPSSSATAAQVRAMVALAEAELALLDPLPRRSTRSTPSARATLADAEALLRNYSTRSR